MNNQEEISRMTVPLPASLKRELKISAAMDDRPLSKQIVHVLKKGLAQREAENAA